MNIFLWSLFGLLNASHTVIQKYLFSVFTISELLILIQLFLFMFYATFSMRFINWKALWRKCTVTNKKECGLVILISCILFVNIYVNSFMISKNDISVYYPMKTIFVVLFIIIMGKCIFNETLFWNHYIAIFLLIIAIQLMYLKSS